MPRKSKDELNKSNNEKNEKKKNSTSTNLSRKNSKAKIEVHKNAKKDTNKKAKSTTSKTANKAKNGTKVSTSKPATSSKSKKETTAVSKKSASNSKKKSTKKVDSKKEKLLVSNVEYYDLPYRYNKTIVKILAQTPSMLFIYWDISDEDRNSYIKKYGENFFNNTKPVLVITNHTMNYTFEVEINDFANSWYLHLNNADCNYSVELGRRPIIVNSNIDNYISISTSNNMQMPNNHILFDKLGKSVFFKNIKNNFIEEKEISSITFMKNFGKVYNIYEIYKELYKNEIELEEFDNNTLNLNLNLSSSNSSTFK